MLRILCILTLLSSPFYAHAATKGKAKAKTEKKVLAPRVITAKKEKEPESPIMLDAGHGGKDGGAQSLEQPVYHEKNLTFTTTKLVESYLRQLKLPVSLTRSDDTFVELDERTKIAEKKNAKLFVSIHYNAALSTSAHGIEVFYYKSDKNKERSEKSKKLAETVLKEIIDGTQAKSRGVKHGNYAVIRESSMPAILIEGGFITNSDELSKIKDPQYLKKIAWGITKGIENYVKNHMNEKK